MPEVVVRHFERPLAIELSGPRHDGVSIYWLGQAGFIIQSRELRIAIDPYLSNSLAEKYRGTAFPHERMAPAPLTADQLGQVDLILCTHHHTDHLDGETLRALASRLPDLRFMVPAASRTVAMQRIGVGTERLILADAGETITTIGGLTVSVLRAAHETLEMDDNGHYRFLGYGLTLDGHRIFHSGDTIPFAGQEVEVSAFAPQVALLPVNGRSQHLRDAGFAGNLTLDEAIALSEACAIPSMIAHHYGMFAFNTADPDGIDKAAEAVQFQLLRAQYQTAFESVI
jgi:L-ascorbate metabolism protein UlaG (beta-lactamase superfamily)